MKFKLTNGKKLYYEVHGEGKPLVILNGIMMSTTSWKEFIAPLSKINQLILVDFLDQGQSDKLTEAYTHKTQIEAIKELLDFLTSEPFHLFGISYGGEIALQFAINYPDSVERLLLFNTAAETSYWLEEVGNAWNKATHDAEAYYLTTIPFIYSPLFFTENKAWMEERKKKLIPLFKEPAFISSMIRLTNSSVNFNVKNKLHLLKMPTLIAGAQYDFVTPFYQQEYLNKNIRNSELVYIPLSGHAIMYEKPHLFVSLIKGFISEGKDKYVL
ncbi:alpha/beta fold hydrolase [Alkalibacterium kapii]|uniref:Putative 2-succinyl-6-hydroxy-2,4-cyclohexadiene-1-carboxylate synthase n=1 Tax=Alkalibacterium kapii TaxID=426704 RepID=A0A511ATF6_9LACT|nr:alpha/beta hydrolase [Alkalibacterium kapii]GEK91396.1 putative 2-succinyl-6-hydroxy-2,4-cyclohexadiene-1-carboxylate synthase [Alkalibacterium kapii]